jgi:hypothetical protein
MSGGHCRRSWATLICFFVGPVWVLVVSPAHAEEVVAPFTQRPKVEVALGAWISAGETRWAHNASGGGSPFGNPTSKLIYQDNSTNIAELTVKVPMGSKFFGRVNLGYAGGGGGTLTDNDYLAADGGDPSLVTQSDLSGNTTLYLNVDGGMRAYTFPNQRGGVDVFAGFQYWHQQYKAYGVYQLACSAAGASVVIDPPAQTLCTPGAAPVSNSVLAITNTTNWYSIRVGGQVEYQLTRHFGLQGSIALIPASFLDNSDIHHLRTDLQQNPSFSMLGFGVGADLDAGVKVMIVRNLFFNLGYRFWWNRMLTGTLTTYPVGAASDSFPLTQFQTYRYGATFGISYTF